MATKKAVSKPTRARKTATTRRVKSSNAATARSDWRVRIRMYRKWLGDCFLLTFCNGAKEEHILIDCGALSGTPAGKATIRAAAEDIRTATDGALRALVVTHEHWDHVSGFSDAADIFEDKFKIDEVWVAWTEDPNQTVAKEKKKQRLNQLAAIEAGLQHWNKPGSTEEQQQMGAAVTALLDFMPPGGLAAFSDGTNTAMKTALGLGKLQFLEPGDILTKSWLPGVQVFVLGPPKDIKALRNTTGNEDTDMYALSLAAASDASLTQAFSAAARGQLPDSDVQDTYRPFDRYLQWDEAVWEDQSQPWHSLSVSYAEEKDRRVDNDWLNSVAELALQLDSYTNNTSLVLAFQFEDSGDVLLFVGDAQIGNWLSWSNVKFKGKTTVSDLLAKTIFYKVGHHGSHNATLKAGGLEVMQSPRLVASIPVDQEFAHRPKGGCPNGWDMPAGPLLKAITEKTKGRILRGDSDFPQGAKQPSRLNDREWKDFLNSVNVEENYIEYFVS